jgi:predicted phage tail protein
MFVPVIAGAGTVGRILLGAALIAGAFFTGGATIGLLGLAAPVAVSSILLGVGASLLLGGVAQLLSPVPETPTGFDSTSDPRKSYSFSSIQNTSRQGTPVPVVYGEVIVGSVVISAGIDIAQVTA